MFGFDTGDLTWILDTTQNEACKRYLLFKYIDVRYLFVIFSGGVKPYKTNVTPVNHLDFPR